MLPSGTDVLRRFRKEGKKTVIVRLSRRIERQAVEIVCGSGNPVMLSPEVWVQVRILARKHTQDKVNYSHRQKEATRHCELSHATMSHILVRQRRVSFSSNEPCTQTVSMGDMKTALVNGTLPYTSSKVLLWEVARFITSPDLQTNESCQYSQRKQPTWQCQEHDVSSYLT